MTYAFSTSGNFWKTRYSFEPDCYGASENYFVSFLPKALTGATGADLCWVHNTNPQRNTFYRQTYPSTISVVSNENPSAEKAYKALSIESNQNVFKAKVSTNLDLPDSSVTKPQAAEVNYFDAREEALYASIGPSKTNSKKNIKLIALVNSQSVVTNYSFLDAILAKIAPSDFSLSIYKFALLKCTFVDDLSPSSLSNAAVFGVYGVTEDDYKYIKQNGTSYTLEPFSAEECLSDGSIRFFRFFRSSDFPGIVGNGDYIVALAYPANMSDLVSNDFGIQNISNVRLFCVYDPELEGDPIRGRYARIDIETQADGKPFELLAVNTEYSMSNLDASK